MDEDLFDCAWCLAAATEIVTVVVEGRELELDLCERHVQQLLTGASAVLCGVRPPRRVRRRLGPALASPANGESTAPPKA